jgi:HD-GYP domain-containing protein (c-di-GMP phosphodiesterase class II)
MIKELQIPLFDLATSFSSAMDLISPRVANHHKQVAYIAYQIASELAMPMQRRKDLILSGALHDIGALSFQERIDTLEFEIDNPHKHAQTGYRLLRMFEPFKPIAAIIRFHHIPWANGAGREAHNEEVPTESHIIHLADRIAVLIDPQKEVFSQVASIVETIESRKGDMFEPQLVECFKRVSEKEFFWLDIASDLTAPYLQTIIPTDTLMLNSSETLTLARVFAKVIDFRSPFTANHSSSVATIAEALAGYLPFSQTELLLIRIAGYLHDLGKLAVPVGILEKQDKLTPQEWNIMRRHTYYGYHVLQPLHDFRTINLWGSLHHERLDGRGYPFHIHGEELTLGSRVMAVADIFAALTEDRPYRTALPAREVLSILQKNVDNGGIDPEITAILKKNYDETNGRRLQEELKSANEYQLFTGISGQ